MKPYINDIFSILTTGAYFYFNWRYFAWIAAARRLPRMPPPLVAFTFALNYAVFIVCSHLEFNLIVNWAVFSFFLFGETAYYSRGRWRDNLYFSLSGILCGLAVNIFCRCAVSIATALPLADFDNHVSSAENLKAVPIALGFLSAGIVMHLMARENYLAKVRALLLHPQHLSFLLEALGGMYLYLFLNLLIYQSRDNGVLLKLWGIKSCGFSLVGAFLAMRYSLRMCELSDYRDKNRAIRLELARKAREEDDLRAVAYRDALTGSYNRSFALETASRLLESGEPFVLCFVDLDRLKEVNDRYGHVEGDRYLIRAARELEGACRRERDVLCRFGGDEFLLLFRDAPVETVDERLRQVDGRLRASDAEPFPMSLSWGAVDSGAADGVEALIRAADAVMYGRKRQKQRA